MKKVLALVLALVLVLSLIGSAIADTYTITNQGDSGAISGHTFTAYQILKADSLTGGKYGNLDWGADVDATAQAALLGSYADIKALAEALGTDDSTTAVAFAQTALGQKSHLGSGTSVTSETTVLGLGLWLIVDNTTNTTDGTVVNKALLYASDNFTPITIISKVDAPSSTKTVSETNDTTSTVTTGQTTADYDIGDDVPYVLTATLPGDFADYTSYNLKFVDDMCAGLTLNTDSVKIFYGASDSTGTTITFNTVSGTEYTGGQKYEYNIANLKDAAYSSYSLTNGSVIRIEYTAKLNASAAINNAGNPNKYHIEYSNDKNTDGSGHKGTTPDVMNVVFTYKTVFNKIYKDNGTDKPLTGADFTLYKKVGGSWVDVTQLYTGTGAVNPTKTVEALTLNSVTAANAKFTFAGLDAGDYKLEETTTPGGYNTIEPIEFTITATHTVTGLTALSGTDGATFTMTADVSNATLSKDIENKSGLVLPSTGGIGTTIFYVAGLIMVLGASIILVARRRADAE